MAKSRTVLCSPALFALTLATQAQELVTRLPETATTGSSTDLGEDAPVGETGRPEWTSARRFTGTRVYLQQDPWEVGVETWWRFKQHRDGSVSHRLLEEVEVGLPYRLQLDLYTDIEGDGGAHFHFQSFNLELRWAPANWGKLPGNPTFYAEYKIADRHWGPDVYELKVLFGDQFAKRWHWGVNSVWEAETGGEREEEFQIPAGLSYSVIDGRLSVGVEMLYDHDTVKGGRGNPANQLNIGPNVQIRPTERTHIDLSCMVGVNHDSDNVIAFLIAGYDFGSAGHLQPRAYTPAAGRGGN